MASVQVHSWMAWRKSPHLLVLQLELNSHSHQMIPKRTNQAQKWRIYQSITTAKAIFPKKKWTQLCIWVERRGLERERETWRRWTPWERKDRRRSSLSEVDGDGEERIERSRTSAKVGWEEAQLAITSSRPSFPVAPTTSTLLFSSAIDASLVASPTGDEAHKRRPTNYLFQFTPVTNLTFLFIW